MEDGKILNKTRDSWITKKKKMQILEFKTNTYVGPICFEFTNYPRTNNLKWLSQSLMTSSDKLCFSNVFWAFVTVLSLQIQFTCFCYLQNFSGLFPSRIQWSRAGGVQLQRGLMRKNGPTLHSNLKNSWKTALLNLHPEITTKIFSNYSFSDEEKWLHFAF